MELETRHIVIGVVAALAIGGGYAWYIAQPDARAPAESAAAISSTAPSANTGPVPVLYKWRDDRGVWNYTDTAPSDRPFETIIGTPNVNSVPTVVPESALEEIAPEGTDAAQ